MSDSLLIAQASSAQPNVGFFPWDPQYEAVIWVQIWGIRSNLQVIKYEKTYFYWNIENAVWVMLTIVS